jgi:hypothetical protein
VSLELQAVLQAVMSFCFCAAGIGEALTTCAHTSLAAARAPAMSPAAALLQIPSTLLLTLAASVGSRSMISLQIATYSFTAAAPVGPTAFAGVAAFEVLAGLLGGAVAVEVVAGLLGAVAAAAGLLGGAVEVVAGARVVVEPLVELPLLPQATSSAEHNSAARSSA